MCRFTVFLERAILGHLHGPRTLQFHAANGALDLADDVKRLGADHPYTRLVPDMSGGVDPDDVFRWGPGEGELSSYLAAASLPC